MRMPRGGASAHGFAGSHRSPSLSRHSEADSRFDQPAWWPGREAALYGRCAFLGRERPSRPLQGLRRRAAAQAYTLDAPRRACAAIER
jgi:hypothetical protein